MSSLIFDNRKDWLAERRNGIGASDVGAALGVCPWKSPYQLLAEKRGVLPEKDLAAENEAIEWGLRLEGAIISAFRDRTGRKVWAPESTTINVHPDYSFLRCTLDATQMMLDDDDLGNLQVKTTSLWNASEWQDGEEIPLLYQVQVQAELAVTGMSWGSIACLIGGQRLVWFDIKRNDEFISAMLPKLSQFWELVRSGSPPEVDGSEMTTRILAQLHPDDDGTIAALPAEADKWIEEMAALQPTIKGLEAQLDLHKNRLRAAIGASTYGVTPQGACYSYKTQETEGGVKVTLPRKSRVLRKAKAPK